MGHVEGVQTDGPAVKGRLGLLADDVGAAAVDLADEGQVGGLHEAPVGARTEALAFRDDSFGAPGIAADDVDTQLRAVVGISPRQRLGHVRANACGSARESSDQRRARRQLGEGGADDAEVWHCDWTGR